MTTIDQIPRCPTDISDETLQKVVGHDGLVIVECGAHDGRDTERFLRLWPACRVFSFEPDPRPIERHEPPGWLDRAGSNPRAELVRAAVSDEDGSAALYRSSGVPPSENDRRAADWDDSNSICVPTGHLHYSPWVKFPESLRIVVDTIRLDTWFGRTNRPYIDLIWADVQGAEAKLIRGATETLKRTRWLYTEFYQTPMYEGQPNAEAILDMLPGWQPRAIFHNENLLLENTACSPCSPSR